MIFKEIKKLQKQSYKCIFGLDEAGRGPLAGPVVACAVEVGEKRLVFSKKKFKNIKDSKKLSAKQREEWYKILTSHQDIKWGIGVVSEKIIDKINILEATKLAMARAAQDLEKKLRKPADFLIIDGNFILNFQYYENSSRTISSRTVLAELRQRAVIKADATIFNCIAAGIIAKVTRDRMMLKMHKKYPKYGFDKHKGYGTKRHIQAIRRLGACPTHRKSFEPIKSLN